VANPLAGQIIRASDVISPIVVIKSATEVVNNSTAYQNDDELFYAMTAGYIYNVAAIISVTGPTAADIKTAWSFSGTLNDSTRNVIGPDSGSTSSSSTSVALQPHAITTTHVYGTNAGASWIREELYLDVLTAGTLQLTWAQSTATASDTSVLAASRLLVTRFATS
jgi:uncharacterized membrane protein